MIFRLLTEHNLEWLSVEKAAQARLSLHLSKCHIVGNQATPQIYCPKNVTVITGLQNTMVVTTMALKGHQLH